MDVVTADVPHAGDLRAERDRVGGRVAHRVHVRPVGDHGARAAAAQDPYHPVSTHPGTHLETEAAQVGGHDAGGSLLLARRLRVPMQVPPHLDQVGLPGVQGGPHAVQPRVVAPDPALLGCEQRRSRQQDHGADHPEHSHPDP